MKNLKDRLRSHKLRRHHAIKDTNKKEDKRLLRNALKEFINLLKMKKMEYLN